MTKSMVKALKLSLAIIIALIFVMNIAVAVLAEDTAASADANGKYEDTAEATETSVESGGIDTDTGWSEIITPNNNRTILYTSRIYDAMYSEAYSNTYFMSVYLSTSSSISSFMIELEMPHFADIQNVSFSPNLNIDKENPAVYEIEGSKVIRASYVSEYYYEGEVELFTVEFTVNQGNVSGYPSIYISQFTNFDGVELYCSHSSGEIVVGYDGNEDGGDVDEYQLGDVDMNGRIDLADLTRVQRSLVFRAAALSGNVYNLADVNRDGNVTILDCQYIKMYLVGKINSFDEIGGGNVGEDYNQITLMFMVNTEETGGPVHVGEETFEFLGVTTLEEIISKFDYHNGWKIISVFYDINFTEPVESGVDISDSKVIYLHVTENTEQSKAGFTMYAVNANTFDKIDEFATDAVEIGSSVEAFANALANSKYSNEYTIEGIYHDPKGTRPIDASLVITEGSQYVVYVLLNEISVSIEGDWDIVERIVTEDGSATQIYKGQVTIKGDTAILTVGNTRYSGTYVRRDNIVNVYFAEKSMYIMHFDKDVFVYIDEFNAEEYTQPAGTDFTKYTGTYSLYEDGMLVAEAVLYDDGIFGVDVDGFMEYGTYTYEVLTETGEVYIILNLMGDEIRCTFDGKTLSCSDNSGDENETNPDVPADNVTKPNMPNEDTDNGMADDDTTAESDAFKAEGDAANNTTSGETKTEINADGTVNR